MVVREKKLWCSFCKSVTTHVHDRGDKDTLFKGTKKGYYCEECGKKHERE